MIDLEMSVDALGRTAFAFSPLGEVVTSVRVLTSGMDNPVARSWARQTRRRLDRSMDMALLSAVIPAPPAHYAPTCLMTSMVELSGGLDDALAELEALPPGQVRADVAAAWGGRPPPTAIEALRGRDAARRLARAIHGYWTVALAPCWPQLRGLLQEEVNRRAAATARNGALTMFEDLHPTLWVEGNLLRIRKPYVDRACVARRVTLVPSAFVWPHVGVFEHLPGQFIISYAARGFGQLFDHEADPSGIELADLLGSTRARLLTLLAQPTTTTEAARRLAHSPGTISRHLAVLHGAGLVSARRQGREVFYHRCELGDSLTAAAYRCPDGPTPPPDLPRLRIQP